MKLPDVLEKLNGNYDVWFRPISWKGLGESTEGLTFEVSGRTRYA